MADPLLNADLPIPQWWIDKQVAEEMRVSFGEVTRLPIFEYYVGVVSLVAKGMMRNGVKPGTMPMGTTI